MDEDDDVPMRLANTHVEDKLLEHIVLPRVLPQEKSSKLYDTEMDLMKRMVEIVENMANVIPLKTVEMFQRLHNVHMNCTKENVSQQINALRPGDTFAMFVRLQHTGIMIHVPSNEKINDVKNVIVSTIPTLHPDEIYKHDSDYEFNYPEQAIEVKFSQILKSVEFANQLCVLYESLPIEETKRDCVSKWLKTLLVTDEKITAPSEYPFITKKIRDEILGSSKTNYFRRSSFYMNVKVMLQHNLTLQLGAENGKLLYKVIMLKYLNNICTSYKIYSAFNIDLLSQMIAKMARRIEKMPKISKTTPDGIASELISVIDEAKVTIDVIRQKINGQISKLQKEIEKEVQLSKLTDVSFESGVSHKISNITEHMERMKAGKKSNNSNDFTPKTYQRFFTTNFPNVESIDISKIDIGDRVFWLEFEQKVLYDMKMNDDRWKEHELRKWSFAYAKYAEDKYKEIPLLVSRMLLVRLKLIAVLDQLVVKKYPLLEQHESGINPNVINELLIPHHEDMCIAYEIEKYFQKRNTAAQGPSLNGEHSISDRSFSVKYAKMNPQMQKILKDVLAADEKNVIEKEKEWQRDRKQAEEYKKEANGRNCEYYKNAYGYNCHARYCKKCDFWDKFHSLRIMQYEHLLPSDVTQQLAIIFELRIPSEIVHLRDVLNNFAEFCLGDSDVLKIKDDWINRSGLNRHKINHNIEQNVALGYTTPENLENLHVECSFDRFIIENTHDCVFHAELQKKTSNTFPDNSIKSVCTFKVQEEEYAGLQWTLDSTKHTQNQVIAKQSHCSQKLTLSEYKNFGSLRADGHRLMLRNLFTMIETESLSFQKESVLALIMQTLWECGISGIDESVRESHIDFRDTKFCSATIELLEKYVNQQRNNWMHPIKLHTVTLIATRAFEINSNDDIACKIAKLLSFIRVVVSEWITKIGHEISQLVNPNEKNEQDLRLKLIYVANVGCLTFFVHPKNKNFEMIFQNDTGGITALRAWLQFIVSLKNSVRMYTNDEAELPPNALMFLRLTECIGVYLEPKIQEMVQQNSNEVYNLIKKLWSRAEGASFDLKPPNLQYPHLLVIDVTIESKKQVVTIDIVSGSFLVDGLPLSRLPDKILDDDSYGWFFKNVVFEVQPDGDSFSTVHKFNNCSYQFKLTEPIIITERNATNDVDKELIDHRILAGEFPHHLVENYSHWWNQKGNCIEFRSRAKDNIHFSKVTDIDYLFHLDKLQLYHVQTQRFMLNIKSDIYEKIIARFARLEHPKHMLVYLESAHVATIELLRMNLKFQIDLKTNDWICNEFNGMRISQTQNVGTLYGLNHGLILENISDSKIKTILIPNGNIQINCTDDHVSVSINTEEDLHSPPFYKYQVDPLCRQLKSDDGSYASWFYLAYLHAITSHGEEEPLTLISGTERALQILQSAFSFSSSPYEQEAENMLKMIADLTPLRTLHENMMVIDWPGNVPQRSAEDCFLFIAQKLLNDSQRLNGLYPKGSSEPLKLERVDTTLNERDHWRCQSLNPNLKVSNKFMPHKVLKTVLPNCLLSSFCAKTRAVCVLYHKNQCTVPANLDLKTFLTEDQVKLSGIGASTNVNEDRLKMLLCHNVHEDFANLWISLYEAARKTHLNREEFAILFSYFAHHGEKIDPILALQAVATNPGEFEHINPPFVESFPISDGGLNSDERQIKISEILREYYNRPDQYYTKDWEDTGKRRKHDGDLDIIINDLTTKIEGRWPCNSFDLAFMSSHQFKYINYANANIQINKQLKRWYKNYQLDEFIKDVEKKLKLLPVTVERSQKIELCIANQIPKIAKNLIKTNTNFEVKLQNCFDALNQEVIDQAQNTWELKTRETIRSASDWWMLFCKTILKSDEIIHLMKAGIFPRIIPSLFLPKIIEKNASDDNDRLKYLIGAWAIEIAREQRQKRIEILKRSNSKAILDKETKHEPHMNWKPCDYPEWLVFEIEQNLTIRRIQIEIAKRMIEPPEIDTKHSVMQLNMGEGKTSVIIPLVAAQLANGKQACQITVLKSLFATNLKSLRQYLGGFLGQKIYIFPCRRDMAIDSHVDTILRIYMECLNEKGVILTLPEYRLSFQLKIYEMIPNQEKIGVAKQLLAIHKWINENVRNVLDESDEILQAKYQLVYTVGKQKKPDAGSQRWLVTQAVLKCVPNHMKDLYLKYGKDKIEFDEKNYRTDVFTPCRILDETVFDALKAKLIDDFLEGQIDIDFKCGSDSKKEKLRHILTQKAITRDEFLEIKRKFSEIDFNTILIVSGLLRFEVLKLALTKRWRVHYGVHVKGRREMAIPFKAKDVASESTEFGHPDVAVCFTQMSYYYSGLDDDQLKRVFEILENTPDAASTYAKWIEKIPSIDSSIQTYSGVNLDDKRQRDELLFPSLRYNMRVIDFYCNLIFSKELKIFEKKLMCTAWDLCSDNGRCTGFSGTNDTKNILPLTVGQNDLEELEKTNENMSKALLHPRNGPYKNLPANVSGKEILVMLAKDDIPVLLDSGALMLELNNKQVAVEWLKQATKYDAAVYFDDNDTLQTVDRNGIVTAFEYSVFKGNLGRCVVYLDDAHTRGTDLKFPPEWKACVTLSGDISRDKTVQSCMRMRQLETSQSISFWASYEADIGIRNVCELTSQATIQNEHVLKFIENNSRRFETANMVHWTTCALNYTKKLIAHKQYEKKEDNCLKKLYEKCVDDDFAKLTEMYGEKEEAKLVDIAYKKFDKIAACTVERNIRTFVRDMQENVDEKLREFASDVKRFTHALDEEQEKELEQEIEEQSQVERPPDAEPAEPKLADGLEQLVIDGANDTSIERMKNENIFLSIPASLANTQLKEFCIRNSDAWSKNLLVTKDFQTVIKSSQEGCDEFLRPLRWIAQLRSSSANNILILLSSYEANRLLPAFRKSVNSTLFMYHPRLSHSHSNLLHEEKLQVSGSSTISTINIQDEVQIAVYSGQMYFKDIAEQSAYCGFLGLIPTPRTAEQKEAFKEKLIKENGFVPPKKRKYEAISKCVANCNFNESPADFAIELIKAHHQVLLKNAHASSILVRGKKVFTEDNAEDVAMDAE